MPFDKLRFIMTFLTILELTEILCSLRLVLERKTNKDIPESSRLEFLEKFLAKYFALSDAEDKASGPLNREGTVDLPLLTTLLTICQKFRESGFWEMMGSFVLLACVNFTASRTRLQQILFCLNFTLESEDLSNDHEDRLNQQEKSHQLCSETEHPVLDLMESQWNLRHQHDQNFSMEGKPL